MAMQPFYRVSTLTQRNPIVTENRLPTPEFLRTINDNIQGTAKVVNAVIAVLDIQDQLQAALATAQEAIVVAQQAAEDAKDAADAAQAQADATKREASLVGSYIDPDSVVTASPTTITIADHTRYYADGTSVAVNGGTAPATASGDVNYVSYVDPDRSGGAVTYIISTTPPVQTGDTHVVGAVTIPADGTNEGGTGPQRPGQVYPNKFAVEEA